MRESGNILTLLKKNSANNMLKEQYHGDVLSRNSWLEPFHWERRGIGMSVPYETDIAKEFEVYKRKAESARFYGLKRKGNLIAARLCIEFNGFYLVFDRAMHASGNLRLVNIDTGKSKKLYGIPFIPVFKRDKPYSPNPADKKDSSCLETIVERLKGRSIQRIVEIGNNTCAVGKLSGDILINFDDNKYIHLFFGKEYINAGKNKLYLPFNTIMRI